MGRYQRRFSELMELLKLTGLRSDDLPANLRVRKMEGEDLCWLVSFRSEYFLVWYNGGEIGCTKVNSGEDRFFPMDSDGVLLSAGTIWYRLAQCLQGDEIDYTERFDDLTLEMFR